MATIKTRIKLRTAPLTGEGSWGSNPEAVKIYKGEVALGLDTEKNQYIIKIGTQDNGSFWNQLTENLTIPGANVRDHNDYQLIEVDNEKGKFKLQKRAVGSNSSWTDVSTISLSFAGGTYNKETNPIALKSYVDSAVSGATTQYFEAIRGAGQTDNDVFEAFFGTGGPGAGITPKGGSTFVIKTLIDNVSNKYEYIAFTYCTDSDFFPAGTPAGTDGVWMAMDGNYSSDNVYMSQNFTLAGSYTQVGNIKLSDGTYNAKGKNLTTVLSDILDQTIQPTLGAEPSMSVTLSSAGIKEAGSEFTPSYTVNFIQGKYKQPWISSTATVNDGTSVTSYTVSDTNGGSSTTGPTSSFTKFRVTDTTNYKVTASVTYSDGSVAKDNKGQDSNPVVKRSGSNITNKQSSAVTGGRYTFYGAVTTENPTINSTLIRGLANKTFNTLSNVSLSFATGTKAVIIAIPKSKVSGSQATYGTCSKETLASILDTNDSNTNIAGAFVRQEVSVNDANGSNPITYSVYVLNRPAGLVADTYKITA